MRRQDRSGVEVSLGAPIREGGQEVMGQRIWIWMWRWMNFSSTVEAQSIVR